jgi:hypothetical protein
MSADGEGGSRRRMMEAGGLAEDASFFCPEAVQKIRRREREYAMGPRSPAGFRGFRVLRIMSV